MKIFNHKKIFFGLLTLGFTSVFFNTYAQQNVSISDVSTTPDASSVLDISSNNKGLLIPRVALTATNVASPITLPATSMLVYNTATAGVSPNNVIPGYYYNAGIPVAPNWLRIYAGSAAGTEWKLLGNVGTTAGTNFLGTTDAVDLVFRTNNTEKVRIMSGGSVGIGTSSPSNKLSVITSTSNDGIYASDGTRWTLHLPGTTGSGSYNNIVAANDNALIFSGGSIGTGNLVIAPWAAATTGIKILGSNGNVGVGISPNDRFEVFPTGGKSVLLGGGATTGSELKLTNSGVVHFSIYNSGNNNLTFANTSTNYQTNTAGAALMSITSGGNVGVGTASPAYKLDLASGTFGFGSSNVRTETRNNAGLRGDAGAQSGFFETASPTNYPSGASSWWHLIDVRHSNNANNYAMQFAGSFYDQNLFFRKTSDNAAQPWTQVLTASSNLAWMTTGNAGTVASTNFIGTTDAIDFVVRTTNTERMRVLSGGNVGVGTGSPVDRLDVRDAMSVNEIKFRNIGGGDDSDPYRLRKVQNSSNNNELQLHLNDDSDERFAIYGNSCSSNSCGEYSTTLYHYFRSDGAAYHQRAATQTIGTGYYNGQTISTNYSHMPHSGRTNANTISWQFGVHGHKGQSYAGSYYYDYRSGGVLGSTEYPGSWGCWGSLGFLSSSGNYFGLYSSTATSGSGAGFLNIEGLYAGIGAGSFGGVIGSWVRGAVLGNVTKGEMAAGLNFGNVYTYGKHVEMVQNGNKITPIYAVSSSESQLFISGKGTLRNGTSTIVFDQKFLALIANGEEPVITITPSGKCNGVYVEVNKSGFTVYELNDGTSNAGYNWIAVAKRTETIESEIPKDFLDPSFKENMDDVMFDENIKERNGKPIWWDGNKLRFDDIPRNKN